MKTHEIELIFRERTESYKEIIKTLTMTTDTTKSFKNLVSKSKDDSKLMSLGITLIAIPDPFLVTDILGSSMVLTELIRRKLKGSSIQDLYKETQKNIMELNKLTKEIIY